MDTDIDVGSLLYILGIHVKGTYKIIPIGMTKH